MRTHPVGRIVTLPLLSLLSLEPAAALAQETLPEETTPVRGWLTGGLGASTEGFAGVAGFDLAVDHHLFSVRGSVASGILGPAFWDVGLLYGRTGVWERGMASASAGLGVMNGDISSGLSRSEPVGARIGIPLAARLAWHPTRVVGLGLSGFGNLNTARSFAGLALTLELGRLR